MIFLESVWKGAPVMATVVEPVKTTRTLQGEQRFVIPGVGWEGYEALLKMVGDGHIRFTCDGKDVELMSPSIDHEEFGNLIGRMIETVTEELHIPCRGLGSTTWRKRIKEKGLEADRCYYLANVPRVRGKRNNIDLAVDPPPDLAIEIEISRSALDRMGIYAALRVPEVWRFDGERLSVEHLQPDGTYATVDASPGLPMLPLEEVVRWIGLAETMDDHTEWNRQLREWVREELLPRHEGRQA